MPILNGAQVGELARIIRVAFDKASLQQLVRVGLNDDLFGRITSDRLPIGDIAFALVTKYEQEDRTAELLAAAAAERPRNVDLRVLMKALPVPQPAPVARPDTAGLAEKFGEGLAALPAAVAVATNPKVFFAIGKLSGWLEPCRNQLRWLRQYKGLHDGLHNLQAKLTAIEVAARDFARPAGPDGQPSPERIAARELLVGHALELQELVAAARTEIGQDPPLPTRDEEAEWVEVLATACNKFEDAVKADDPVGVTNAVLQIRGLVRQTAVVNDHMLFLSRGLQLAQLTAAMQAVDDCLGGIAGANVTEFRAGLGAVRRLGPDVTNLVEEHDSWQALEADFALAASQTQTAPADRFPNWPAASASLTALCAINHGDWLAERVIAAATGYAAARTGPKPAADLAFVSVRLAFTKMFFKVDSQLLDLTRQLAAQADALDAAAQGLANLLHAPAPN